MAHRKPAFPFERRAGLLQSAEPLQRQPAIAHHGRSQLDIGSALPLDAHGLVQQLQRAPRHARAQHRHSPIVEHGEVTVASLAPQLPVLAQRLFEVALGFGVAGLQCVGVSDSAQQRGFDHAAVAALAAFLQAALGIAQRIGRT